MSFSITQDSTYLSKKLNKLSEVDISPHEYSQIMQIQHEILDMLSTDVFYQDVLKRLCHLAEALLNNSVASLMLLDSETKRMNVIVAPSIPTAGKEALKELKPGYGSGSCGNAVFKNSPVYVYNTFEDKRWENIRELAVDFNICSCWSMPIRDENGIAFGSFALSSFEHRRASAFHKLLLKTSASIIEIVLKKESQDQIVRASVDKLKLFATVAEHAVEGMVITNANNEIIEINSACKDIFGYSQAQILGKNPRIFASGKHDKPFYKNMWNALHTDGHWVGEVINKRRNGTLFSQWMSISEIRSKKEEDKCYVAVFTDISELKKTQEQLSFIAYHDRLTALPNNNKLQSDLREKHGEKSLALLNIDNFHYLNTVYGFSFGDIILKEVSALLKECAHTDQIFRSGGDEFALFFDSRLDMEPIIFSIQQKLLNQNINVNGVRLTVSFSYGVASGEEKLYEHAILALKMAKERGKNQFYIYDNKKDNVNKQKKERFITWSKRLYDALESSDIIPYFQGIRDNTNAKVYKFEVLARLVYQDDVSSPYHFMEPAKLAGLLPRLTKMIIDKSFAIMQNYTYDFSINISEDDLNANYLLEYLLHKAKIYNIPSHRVTLEILEGISDTSDHLNQLNQLKAEGFLLAIDDFGAGNSNFAHLMLMKVDYIKIDGQFVKDIITDEQGENITKTINAFAHMTGAQSIAEFVSDEKIFKRVEELGVDFAQGYYISEPKPASQIDTMLRL